VIVGQAVQAMVQVLRGVSEAAAELGARLDDRDADASCACARKLDRGGGSAVAAADDGDVRYQNLGSQVASEGIIMTIAAYTMPMAKNPGT
jgi:hypothetical protein